MAFSLCVVPLVLRQKSQLILLAGWVCAGSLVCCGEPLTHEFEGIRLQSELVREQVERLSEQLAEWLSKVFDDYEMVVSVSL